MTDAEAEVARLRAVIERNRSAFEELKADANRWRDRALKAEAALAEARRAAKPADDGMGWLRDALVGKGGR